MIDLSDETPPVYISQDTLLSLLQYGQRDLPRDAEITMSGASGEVTMEVTQPL